MDRIAWNVREAALVCFALMLAASACGEGPVVVPSSGGIAGSGREHSPDRLEVAGAQHVAGRGAGSGGSLMLPTKPDAGAAPDDDAGAMTVELCGNGRLDPSETCDDSARGKRCPADRNDCAQARDICWSWRVVGMGCQRTCVHDQPVCGDILDPREPDGLVRSCTEGCPVAAGDPWR